MAMNRAQHDDTPSVKTNRNPAWIVAPGMLTPGREGLLVRQPSAPATLGRTGSAASGVWQASNLFRSCSMVMDAEDDGFYSYDGLPTLSTQASAANADDVKPVTAEEGSDDIDDSSTRDASKQPLAGSKAFNPAAESMPPMPQQQAWEDAVRYEDSSCDSSDEDLASSTPGSVNDEPGSDADAEPPVQPEDAPAASASDISTELQARRAEGEQGSPPSMPRVFAADGLDTPGRDPSSVAAAAIEGRTLNEAEKLRAMVAERDTRVSELLQQLALVTSQRDSLLKKREAWVPLGAAHQQLEEEGEDAAAAEPLRPHTPTAECEADEPQPLAAAPHHNHEQQQGSDGDRKQQQQESPGDEVENDAFVWQHQLDLALQVLGQQREEVERLEGELRSMRGQLCRSGEAQAELCRQLAVSRNGACMLGMAVAALGLAGSCVTDGDAAMGLLCTMLAGAVSDRPSRLASK